MHPYKALLARSLPSSGNCKTCASAISLLPNASYISISLEIADGPTRKDVTHHRTYPNPHTSNQQKKNNNPKDRWALDAVDFGVYFWVRTQQESIENQFGSNAMEVLCRTSLEVRAHLHACLPCMGNIRGCRKCIKRQYTENAHYYSSLWVCVSSARREEGLKQFR